MSTEEPILPDGEKPEDLTRDEIERRIAEAKEELGELAQERRLTLVGTGVHIGGREAQRLREEFEEDMARVRARIEELESYL